MTRGQIAIITDNKIYTSNEFNGDMYMSNGLGRTVTNGLKRVKDIADYQYFVAKFNKEHHHYNDLEHIMYEQSQEALDFNSDYFDKWFSDYIYIKNIGTTPKTINASNGTYNLAPNQIARLCFGRLEKISE